MLQFHHQQILHSGVFQRRPGVVRQCAGGYGDELRHRKDVLHSCQGGNIRLRVVADLKGDDVDLAQIHFNGPKHGSQIPLHNCSVHAWILPHLIAQVLAQLGGLNGDDDLRAMRMSQAALLRDGGCNLLFDVMMGDGHGRIPS